MAAKTLDADVIVVGGGPAGCTLTALLAANGAKTICIDRDAPAKTLNEHFDGRTTAISYGSQQIMQSAGIWDDLSPMACPIEDIQILDSGSPVLLEFLVKDVNAAAFGWIVENRTLRASLYKRLQNLDRATHIAPARVADFSVDAKKVCAYLDDGRTFSAKLLVGADGRNSFTRDWMGINTRGWPYRQTALACVVTHEHAHNLIAVEDFRPEGPFAILPMTDDNQGRHRSSIVWTDHGKSHAALRWNDDEFIAALQERFPDFYGQILETGPRFSYPLGLSHAHRYIGNRMALVADAAHAIHPIAGQGLNIGLRDVSTLASLVTDAVANNQDPGTTDILENYQRQRRPDNMAMAAATDALNRLFSNDAAPIRLLRKTGLRVVQRLPATRRFFMKQAMGLGALFRD